MQNILHLLRSWRQFAWLFLCALGIASSNVHGEDLSPVDQLKASYLVRILSFVDWHDDAQTPILICVAGDQNLVEYIKGQAEGKTVSPSDRSVEVVRAESADSDCQVTYFAAQDAKQPSHNKGLRVGASPMFESEGTAINFFENDGKVRFEIYPKRLQKQGTTLSSELLKLARVNQQE